MDSLNEIWACVLSNIASSGEFSEPTYNLWFRDLELLSLTNNYAIVDTKTQLKKDIISSRYIYTLEKYLADVIGFEVPITLEVYEETKYGKVKIIEEPKRPSFILDDEIPEEERGIKGNVDEDGLTHVAYNPLYTFDNFIVGNTNKFAHAACKAIAADAEHSYNPLFIYGSSGLGKTHLLYAITNEIILRRKNTNAVYVRGEDFANEMITSLSKKVPMQYFRDKYRKADVLLVDDVQFIAGKPSTQEEFFHTFNTLYEDKKQIILACDRPVKEIPSLEERLKARFEWGLTVDIQPPDYELRFAILKSKAIKFGLNLSDNILMFLADNIKGNIRRLEGAIKRLHATSLLIETQLTFDKVKECLQDMFSDSVPSGVTIDEIFEIVSKKYSVAVEDIKGKKRTKELSNARHITIYILRTITNLSLSDIGGYFSMHHTSVLSAYSKISEDIKVDPALEHNINEMIRTITGQ
ncbi:MAG: chromosomal replication initiator protein DnaA [Ruminococcaceae bacterium]|nr:chromosomal replication initiator protein DnaA [Oscillospiraceae bacterium]